MRKMTNSDVSLFLGFGTAYCGSVTTFSSWMFDVFNGFNNSYGYNHNGVKNVSHLTAFKGKAHFLAQVADAFTQIFLTMAVATSGLRFGIHTSTFLVRIKVIPPQPVDSPELDSEKKKHSSRRTIFHIVMICVGFSTWAAVALLTAFYKPWRKWCLALTFAPIGCYIRYLLAITLNPLTPHFPLGTFSANMIATAFLAMLQIIMQNASTRYDSIGCNAALAMVEARLPNFATKRHTDAFERATAAAYQPYRLSRPKSGVCVASLLTATSSSPSWEVKHSWPLSSGRIYGCALCFDLERLETGRTGSWLGRGLYNQLRRSVAL